MFKLGEIFELTVRYTFYLFDKNQTILVPYLDYVRLLIYQFNRNETICQWFSGKFFWSFFSRITLLLETPQMEYVKKMFHGAPRAKPVVP